MKGHFQACALRHFGAFFTSGRRRGRRSDLLKLPINFYTSCLSRKSRWRECWRVGWRVVTGHGRKYFVCLEAFRFLLLSLRGKDFGLLSVLILTGFWAQIDRYTSKDLFCELKLLTM